MAIRIARGLFRLWIVLSVLWIGCVGAITWGQYVYYEPISGCSTPYSVPAIDKPVLTTQLLRFKALLFDQTPAVHFRPGSLCANNR
jgi:hypothetical protein